MNPARRDARDRLEQIATCYEAIGDLLSPGLDIQDTQRDHMAVLMDFLAREHRAAFDDLYGPAGGGTYHDHRDTPTYDEACESYAYGSHSEAVDAA